MTRRQLPDETLLEKELSVSLKNIWIYSFLVAGVSAMYLFYRDFYYSPGGALSKCPNFPLAQYSENVSLSKSLEIVGASKDTVQRNYIHLCPSHVLVIWSTGFSGRGEYFDKESGRLEYVEFWSDVVSQGCSVTVKSYGKKPILGECDRFLAPQPEKYDLNLRKTFEQSGINGLRGLLIMADQLEKEDSD